MGRRQRRALLEAVVVVAGFAAGYTVLFAPVLVEGRVLGVIDAILYYWPAFTARHLGWNPLLYAGHPVQGDPQAMFWYPPAALFSGLARVGPAVAGWNGFVVTAYAIAASTAYGLALRCTGSRLAALVAGIGYGTSGYLVAHLDHASLVHSAAWVPLLLWSLEELRACVRARWVAAGALATGACVLGGHPQIVFYTGLLAAGYVVFASLGAAPAAGRVRFLAAAAAVAVLGSGLAAVSILPFLELVGLGLRGSLAPADVLENALPVAQLGQLLAPYLFGGAVSVPGGSPGLPYFGEGIPSEIVGFAGALPLLFAGLAIVRCWWEPRVRFFAVVALVAVLLALGDAVPGASFLASLPGFDRLRIPGRTLMAWALAVSVLSAFGVAWLERQDARRRWRAALLATSCLLVAGSVAAAATSFAIAGGAFSESMYRAGVDLSDALPWRSLALGWQAGAIVLGCGAVLLFGRSASPAVAVLLVAAVALDLASHALFADWRMSPRREVFAMPSALAPLRDTVVADGQRIVSLTFDAPGTAAPPNRSDAWGIPSATGYGPLPLGRHARMLGLSAAHFDSPRELGRALGGRDVALDLLAVRYVLLPDDTVASEARRERALHQRPTREGAPSWRSIRLHLERSARWRRRDDLAGGLPGALVYENLRARPRAWLVGETRELFSEDLLRAVRGGRLPGRGGGVFDPARIALVESAPAAPVDCPEPCGEVEVVALEDRRIRVRVRAAGTAMLVVSDTAHPGWRAWVGGAEVPVQTVDYTLRGVVVPPGESDVLFEFRSPRFAWGAGLSLVSLALTALLLARRTPVEAAGSDNLPANIL